VFCCSFATLFIVVIFVLRNTFLGRGLDRYKDSFNYWLSHSHQAVERAFGMLTQRWGIFWCPFHFSFGCWMLVIMCCIKLHKICVDRNVPVPFTRFHEDVRARDEWHMFDNQYTDDIDFREGAVGDWHHFITSVLEANCIACLIHAAMNSS
jgi:hypothetical protein